jgi:hypothetical protein
MYKQGIELTEHKFCKGFPCGAGHQLLMIYKAGYAVASPIYRQSLLSATNPSLNSAIIVSFLAIASFPESEKRK